MDPIQKVVVLEPLGQAGLRKSLGRECNIVQQRILNSSTATPFAFPLTEAAKDWLLHEGTDMKYGARHLKRAIDRALVQPLSNLIATGQVRGGDSIWVDFNPALGCLTFYRDGEDMPADEMANLTDPGLPVQAAEVSQGTVAELTRAAKARSARP